MNHELPILRKKPSRTMSRREAARTLLSGLAAGIFLPGLSPLHPIHEHLRSGASLDSADEILASGNYRPIFLSEPQLASLDKIADSIVPGSHRAQSAEFIDVLLSVDAPDSQQEFVESLAALQAAAGKTFHKNIVSLNDAELNELLQMAAAQGSAEGNHFNNLKGWAIGAYYSSEIGMRELGWTPDRVFSSFPVCTNAESHS